MQYANGAQIKLKQLYAKKKKELRLLKAGFAKLKKQFVEVTEDLQQAKARLASV